MMMQIKRFVKEGNSSENAKASRRISIFTFKMYNCTHSRMATIIFYSSLIIVTDFQVRKCQFGV